MNWEETEGLRLRVRNRVKDEDFHFQPEWPWVLRGSVV